MRFQGLITSFTLGVAMLGTISTPAHALPSFARQTGQPCTACHMGGFGPQLTPFGMLFKIGGYTMSNGKSGNVPVSAMAIGSWTHTSQNQSGPAGPYDSSNNNFALDQAAAFVAGAITDHIGALAQATYSDIDRKVVLDNVDIRYARNAELFGSSTVLGISLNNNPTVQDPSNSLPGWRFPFTSSGLAPTPTASPLIDGGLGQQVIGVTGYGYWNNAVYAEVGGYKTLSKSFLDKVNADSSTAIKGVAPYWRVAYMNNGGDTAWGAGLFGLNAALLPDRVPGARDRYSDVGVDTHYLWLHNPEHAFGFNAAYIRERTTLNASYAGGGADNRHDNLHRLDVTASYFYQETYGLTVSHFAIGGTRDMAVYATGDPDVGSITGSPDSDGWIVQADWTPFGKSDSWEEPFINLRLGLQYTLYNKFNGATHNYDGYGRNASDNNTLYGFAWLSF